uniref:chitin synthase n=1 Tax=Heterorhabditis bacteriophora TaxID=37862 RepID=A0A1I7XS62_HETBA
MENIKELIKRQDEEISLLKQEARKAAAELEVLRKSTEKKDVEQELEQIRAQLEQSCKLNTQNQATQLQLQELHRINEQWRMEAEKYKQWAQQWQQYQIAQLPDCYEVVATQLKQQMAELEQQLEYGYHAFEEQSRTMSQMAIECAEWRHRAEAAEGIIKGNSNNAQKNGEKQLNGTSEHDENISMDDDNRWNAFRSHKRTAFEKPALTPWMINALQSAKLLLFLLCNMFLTFGAGVSKICVLILSTNIIDNNSPNDLFSQECSRHKAVLPLGLLSCSFGFWESWIGTHHSHTIFHDLYQVKYGVRKLNPSTRLSLSMARIITVLSVMMYASSNHVKPDLFWHIITTYDLNFPYSRIFLLSIGLSVLHFSLRGCARFLAAMGINVLSIFHPVTVVPLVGYFTVRMVCTTPYCPIEEQLSKLSLQWKCDHWGGPPKPFDDWYILMIWLAVGTYRGWQFVSQKSFDKCDEVIESMSPVSNGFCIEQSLVVFQHSLKRAEATFANNDIIDLTDELRLRNDEVDRTLTVYICATMWHETATEMTQMLRSILKLIIIIHSVFVIHIFTFQVPKDFRLDEEHARRFNNEKPEQIQFRLEDISCIWITYTFDLVIYSESVDESGCMVTRILVNTPYGGRLVVKLPAGTLLFVHLKDRKLIRHKKRWSQVMYMYYLLGHRIMDSPMSIEDRQQLADNTFILAIDGDSKFEPEAVMRLLNLMNTKSDIGCACGRIHPIGSGVMVWYQKFEYAIAHWFQKAAEHVFGCVLCAPGCFSLFRASALMDDNIMHKYTKTAQEPRHFVQYDQGEDRWLSTLLLKQGYRIEYVAASDAETYAPEGFEEFFNQRRRWTPSSIANTIDLLSDYKRASENNDSISTGYIAYQFMVISFSMLGPAIIFTMLVFAQVAAFGSDSARMMIYNGVPILLFIVLCFTTESNIQLFYAKILSIIYAFVMLAVLIATSNQIVLETVMSPTSMFIVAMVAIFFISACLHPKEFKNIIYGIFLILELFQIELLIMYAYIL